MRAITLGGDVVWRPTLRGVVAMADSGREARFLRGPVGQVFQLVAEASPVGIEPGRLADRLIAANDAVPADFDPWLAEAIAVLVGAGLLEEVSAGP